MNNHQTAIDLLQIRKAGLVELASRHVDMIHEHALSGAKLEKGKKALEREIAELDRSLAALGAG